MEQVCMCMYSNLHIVFLTAVKKSSKLNIFLNMINIQIIHSIKKKIDGGDKTTGVSKFESHEG